MLKKGKGQRGRKKERDILFEGDIKELVRNLALGKFPGILKDDPS